MISRRHKRVLVAGNVNAGKNTVANAIFAYWHDQEETRMINRVTKDDNDPASKEPEFKICAVQVKRVSGPKPLKPFIVA